MAVIDYSKILEDFPWIIEKKQKCILSPDSDGFLCGLFMTSLLDWDVSGFYDGKVLLIRDGLNVEDCVFLDMDVNRATIRSMGHHMVVYNKRLGHGNMSYENCIQPNIFRNFDGKNDFQRKYPFGTIHLLLGILQNSRLIDQLPANAIWPLLFTDGTWNNLFGYTENCLDWIEYLGITDESHILNYLFCANPHSFYSIMQGLNNFLRLRDSYNAVGYYANGGYTTGGRNKRTGDKLKISNPRGQLINLEENTTGLFRIHQQEKDRIANFITHMGNYVGLEYHTEKWIWEDFKVIQMQKGDFSNSSLSNISYIQLMEQNPFSMAMTSGVNIEYTLWPGD